jgi:exopolysaccharide biosynthesis polyprenyl glycosylphosphotransferase
MTDASPAKSVRELLVEVGLGQASASLPKIHHRFQWLEHLAEILADEITIVAAVCTSYLLYHHFNLGRDAQYPIRSLWIAALAVATLYVILLDRDGAYRPGNSLLRIKETETSLRVTAEVFLLVLPLAFFANLRLPRWLFLISLILVPTMQIIQKQLLFLGLRKLRSAGFGVKQVVIYGAGAVGRRVFSALIRSPKLGMVPVAMITDDPTQYGQVVFEYSYHRNRKLEVMSASIDADLLRRLNCDFLVIAAEELGSERLLQLAQAAQEAHASVGYMSASALAGDYLFDYADLDGMMLNVVGQPERNWYYESAKRPFDFLGALALIVMTSPIWLAIALAIRFDSPGPILFRQKRVGIGGHIFEMFKFRSMHVNAPKYGFSPKKAHDPRITRIGRFLRRTSLDELPQLLNVLRGDMSLVGPRPEMPFIVAGYNALQRQRLAVLPGITGLWQLSADRSELIHENIQYDLYYITHRSFFMDCAVLIHTLLFAMHGV